MSTELKQAAQQALEALETCRIRSVSEWSVEDVTPKNITAAIESLRTAIQQAEAQQPVTGEPVGYMNEGHIHELAMGRIPYGYVYPEAGAGASTAVYAHPAPSVLKDDQIAALVNKVRDIARMFHDHQSLRERIAIELVPALKAKKETP